LARHAEAINALNVFPVPDGDTGTNMALTMQAAIKQVEGSPSHSAGEIAAGIAYGALMGARGNSGVILSQIWRGFAEGVADKHRITARDFAHALSAATTTAYRAVLKPVEGTILTVIKDAGQAAVAAADKLNSFSYVLEETTRAAKVSVARTPSLLDKLREAGVVDAGGQGLYVLLDGIRRIVQGEDLEAAEIEGEVPGMELVTGRAHVEHGEYGYCTNFIMVGGGWDFDEVRARIASLGESAVIVGDDNIVKVHIHTETPGTVLNYATSLGSLHQISIANMQEQHEEFLQMHAAPPAVHKEAAELHVSGRDTEAEVAASRIALLPVVSGEGLVEAFKSMGATSIIEGGQTMNPSTEDILKVIERVPQNEVIILPNNRNIVMAANQTRELTSKRVEVVPTETIPQGMAALIAFNYDAPIEDNVRAMQQAAAEVQTAEITRAVRDAKVNGMTVKAGQIIGLLNNTLVATGTDLEELAWDLFERMNAAQHELITIYWGGDLTEEQARRFSEQVQARYPNAQVELVFGGQPFYDYIISVE
jgi:DAK2 domain fusion protein YloV